MEVDKPDISISKIDSSESSNKFITDAAESVKKVISENKPIEKFDVLIEKSVPEENNLQEVAEQSVTTTEKEDSKDTIIDLEDNIENKIVTDKSADEVVSSSGKGITPESIIILDKSPVHETSEEIPVEEIKPVEILIKEQAVEDIDKIEKQMVDKTEAVLGTQSEQSLKPSLKRVADEVLVVPQKKKLIETKEIRQVDKILPLEEERRSIAPVVENKNKLEKKFIEDSRSKITVDVDMTEAKEEKTEGKVENKKSDNRTVNGDCAKVLSDILLYLYTFYFSLSIYIILYIFYLFVIYDIYNSLST